MVHSIYRIILDIITYTWIWRCTIIYTGSWFNCSWFNWCWCVLKSNAQFISRRSINKTLKHVFFFSWLFYTLMHTIINILSGNDVNYSYRVNLVHQYPCFFRIMILLPLDSPPLNIRIKKCWISLIASIKALTKIYMKIM